jgi:hypothetical protein
VTAASRRRNAAHALPFSAALLPQDEKEKEQECGNLWIIRTGAAELLAAGCSIPPLVADRAGNSLGSTGLVFLSSQRMPAWGVDGRGAASRERRM